MAFKGLVVMTPELIQTLRPHSPMSEKLTPGRWRYRNVPADFSGKSPKAPQHLIESDKAMPVATVASDGDRTLPNALALAASKDMQRVLALLEDALSAGVLTDGQILVEDEDGNEVMTTFHAVVQGALRLSGEER